MEKRRELEKLGLATEAPEAVEPVEAASRLVDASPPGSADTGNGEQSEKRASARVFLKTRGRLLLADGQELPCLLHDVSLGGAYVSGREASLGVGSRVTLSFAIGRSYEIGAVVVRVDASHRPHPGLGLEWITADEDTLHRLAMEIARIMVNRRRQQGRY